MNRRGALQTTSALALAAAGATLESTRNAAQAAPEETPNRRIRIGVVGGGFGSAFHWHEQWEKR